MDFRNEFGFRKRVRRTTELNLINMIDMLFFLLVFFVMTNSYTKETGLDVSKPKAASSKSLDKEHILIGITRDGAIHINESAVSLKTLGAVLKRYMDQDPTRPVVVVADRNASIAVTVDVLDECNLAGVPKVSLSSVKE